MKLHLPHGLRKALLACLAALALPVSLPSTIASASGWIVVSLLAPQQVVAADVTFTGARTSQSGDPYSNALQNSNTENDTWTFNVPTGATFYFGTGQNVTTTHNANFSFAQTLTIDNGFSGADQIFNGAFTGQQGANLVFAWASHTSTWQFNGSLSGFAGDILATKGTLNIVFGENGASNTGAIKRDGGTLNLTLNGQTMQNSEISVNNLTVNGSVGFKDGSQVTAEGTTTFGSGASLTLGKNTQMHLTSLADGSTLNSLTMGAGAGLALGSGDLSLGTLTIGDAATKGDGTPSTLSANSKESTVTVTGAVVVNSGYELELENVTLNAQAGLGCTNINYDKQGTLTVGTGAVVNVSGSIANVGNAPAALVVHQLNVEGGTLDVTENDTWVNTSWGNVPGPNLTATQVTAGGNLTTQNFATPHSVLVSGTNSRMTVNGTAKLNNNARLTVKGGGSVTITGALTGNKPSSKVDPAPGHDYAGVVTVGSHQGTDSTNGTLTLGTDGKVVTHKTYAVKVYGGESKLTIYGNLSAIGSEKENDDDESNDTGIALEVMYGAAATVSGNLTLENSQTTAGGLRIGGTEGGNTGTLRVDGNLTGASVSVQGKGSTLTVGGAVTLSADSTLGAGATFDLREASAFNVTGTGLTINVGTADVATDGVFSSGKLLLSSDIIGTLSGLNNLKVKFTNLTDASFTEENTWTCDLFAAGTELAAADAAALTAFLEKALDRTGLDSVEDIVVDTNGNVTIGVEGDDLYIDATGEPITWKNKGDTLWHEGGTAGPTMKFKNRDSVTFSGQTDTTGTVTMEGELVTDDFSVADGTWTFKNSTTLAPSLTIRGEVTVAEEALVSWESLSAVTILGNSFIDGTWTGERMVVTLGDAAASNASEITMEVGGDSGTSSMDVASILTAGGEHAPTTHLVVTQQGHLTVTGEVNVTDATVGGTQSVSGIATGVADAAGPQLVVGNLTLTGSSTSADESKDVLRVSEGWTVKVSGKLTSTGTNARITVDGGTLIVGPAPSGDPGTPGDAILMTLNSGLLDVSNGGSLEVYGNINSPTAEQNGFRGIKSFTMSGDETTVDVYGSLYAYNVAVDGGLLTVDERLGLTDPGTEGNIALAIEGGAVVQAGIVMGSSNGHADRILVGNSENGTSGTLTVGSEEAMQAATSAVDALKTRGMKVQAEGSVVTVWGDVNIYQSFSDDFALIVDGGTMDIKGSLHGSGATAACTGVDVTGGGNLTIGGNMYASGLNVEGEGSSLAVTGGIIVSSNSSPMTVAGGGSLTAGSISGGENGQNGAYFGHSHASTLNVGEGDGSVGKVVVGSEDSPNALLQVKQLIVNGTGSSVTVWGNLSSSYSDASSITGGSVTVSGGMVQVGELTIDGGTLKVGGYYAKASNATTTNGGAITLSNGGSMTVGGGLHSSSVTLTGAADKQSKLTLSDAQDPTANTVGSLSVGANTTVEVETKQTLTVGSMSGAGDITIKTDGEVTATGELTSGDTGYTGTVTLDGGTFTGKTAAGATLGVVMANGANGGTLNGVDGGLAATLSGTGTGRLTAQGTLTLSGAIAGQLQVTDGARVTITGNLSVGRLDGGENSTVDGDGNLTITGGGGSFGGPLTVGSLKMSGSGTQTFTGSTTVNGSVSVTQGELILQGETSLVGGADVSGGTLTLKNAETTLGAGAKLKVGTGSKIVLDFGSESWNQNDGGNINVELAGGTLDMSKLMGDINTQEVHLNHLSGTGGSLEWTGSLETGNKQSVHVGELSLESGTLNFGKLGDGQELHLKQLKNVNGEITGEANGGTVYLGHVNQEAGKTGSIGVTGGEVHVHRHRGGNPDGFWKQGEGSFAVKSKLIVEEGSSLYMNYDGTLTFGASDTDGSVGTVLTGGEISVASGVTLKYTGQNKLLLLGSGLFDDFTKENGSSLHLDLTQTDLSRFSGGFDLGIVSTREDADLLTQLKGVIELDDIEFGRGEDGTEGYFDLSWHDEANGTYHLYLDIVGEFTFSDPEWDMAWGDGLIGAPSNADMNKHMWSGGDDTFHASTGTAGGFTAHALELGTGSDYIIDGMHTLICLTQGAAKTDEKTAATVIGGIIMDDAGDPKNSYFDSYIEYNVDYEIGDKDHIHLLVGGSSCVYAGGGEGAYASFVGTSHIQMESGTVDYIVGGNHVNNSTFTFKGDSYITVFGGQVLGSVVGGSTLTKGTSDDSLYAFNGNTNIFIYTPLQGTQDREGGNTPAISDGTEGTGDTGHGAAFTAVVGGNAWVDFATAKGKEMKPQFSGHTHITIDLVNPAYIGDETYTFGAGRDKGNFEKAIVGGNYTAAVTASEEGGTRTTVFRGDAQIEIYAKEDHIFTAGINGASRWDSGGAGTTEFTGDTHVEIHGGQYTEAVAGGMWFNATGGTGGALAKHEGTFTGDTDVQIEDGRLWRVVGGNVSLEGGTGSEETFTGVSNVTINGGTFSAREQDTLEATAIPAVVGGSFYRNTTGNATHVGAGGGSVESALTNVTINGGTFEYVHIVGGDCVNMNNVTGTSITLEGGTHLVIGEQGSTTEPEIVGLLSGGSHLSDSGAGGSITVGKEAWKNQKGKYATEVEIHGGTITAEGIDGSNQHTHGNVAVVAGNVLLDSSKENGGGHRSEIWGGTHLVMDGGTVYGFVVGGSYSSDSLGGKNDLVIAGDSTMEFTGGTVEGDIVGGHFSENTSAPDTLTLGNVHITVDGGTVKGDIFGGSYRKATRASDESPTQGDITITLTSGTIHQGGVYAAGSHSSGTETSAPGEPTEAADADEASLHVRTNSTRVEIGIGMEFEVEQPGAENQYIVVSGGYLRSGDTADYSTVGYTEGQGGAPGTWTDECAVLSFTDDPSKYSKLTSAELRFQDFDAIEVVKEGTLVLNESRLLVMHKETVENVDGKDISVTGSDSFAKMGAGSLVLGKGLGSYLGQSDKVADFTGKIILDGGTLTLGGGGEQSLAGGLQVNMAGRTPGNKSDAYLQVFDANTKFTIGELSEEDEMEITLENEANETLKTGVYYIADGLVGLTPEVLQKYLDGKYINLNLWEGALDDYNPDSKYECHLELRGENSEQLVLRVKYNDPDSWIWEGNEDGVWAPGKNENWTHDPVPEGDEGYKNDIYYFNSGAVNSGAAECEDVKVASGIEAREIHVESGQYRFVQQPTEGGGVYTGLKVGILQVGVKGGEGLELADIELALPTGNIGVVELYDNGRFAIGHGQAIQGNTQLKFCDKGEGILKYAENGNGYLVYNGNLSGQVSEGSAEGTVLHIQVGNGAMDDVEEVVRDDTEGVTWSGGKGVELAVSNGIVKTGRKMFQLNWTPGKAVGTDDQFNGTLEAEEGELVLEVEGDATIAVGKDAKLTAEKGATLKLQVKDGSTLTVSRAASGAGEIRIGSDGEEGVQTYILNTGVSKDFTGTVALEGNGTSSTVKVQTIGALGNVQSTLALEGRAIELTEEAAKGDSQTISVKAITVRGTNYVGGYATTLPENANRAITLNAADGITGNEEAVLANAQGGYKHTLEGDLSKFIGTIVAGVAPAAETPSDPEAAAPEESTWTLSGTLANPAEVATSLAGTGKVIVDYTLSDVPPETPGKVLLTGSIGDATLGNSVSVEHAMEAGTVLVLAGENNTTTGNLIFNGNEIWLGDENHASSWVGGVAKGTGEEATSRFVLRNGTLGKALEDKDGITLAVDTAVQAPDEAGVRGKTLVDVGGTAGSQFDEIVINDSGHLSGVEGDITVGSGEGQTRVVLHFGVGSCGEAASSNAADYLIESTGNLVINEVQSLFQDGPEDDLKEEAAFVIDFSNEGLFELLKAHRDGGTDSYLHVLSGGDIIFEPGTVEEQLNELLRTGTYSKLLYGLTFTLGVEGGDLILRGSSSDVYLVLGDESDPQGNKHTVSTAEDADILTEKKATLLDKGTTLTVELGEEKAGDSVTVHNLVGLSGSVLEATGEGTVVLDNTEVVPDPLETDPWVGDKVEDAGGNRVGKLKGQDTYFDGMIRGKDVQTRFVKTGAGTLTVGDGTESGGVDIAGELRLEDGDFVVHGGENGVLGTLTFAYGEGAVHEKDFVVQGGKVTVGALKDETGGGKVTLEQRGTFAFVGDNTVTPLENLQFTGSGTLEVGGDEDGGKLALGGTSSIAGPDVQVDKDSTLSLRDGAVLDGVGTVTLSENATLDLSGSAHEAQHTVGTLTDNSKGTGVLRGGANTDLKVTKGGSFGGTLSGSGKLSIAGDATFSMAGVKTDVKEPAGAWGITVQGSLTLDTSEQHGGSGPVFGDVSFETGSDITLRFDYNADKGSTAWTHSLSIREGAHLTLESVSAGTYPGSDLRVRIAYSEVEGKVEDVEVELKGVSFLYFEKDGGIQYDSEKQEYYVGVKEVKENRFEQALPGMDKNAQAGAELFWSAFAPNKNEALGNVLADQNSDLSKMRDALTGMLDNKDKAGLERTLAAGAGASISVLGPALAEDMHRQLISMRNRSTTLTEDLPTDGYDAFPYWHAWITGEGGYHKLDADGFAPGYTLNNWGGSVGADANITQRTSVGLALTAMYGDLKPDAADSASGNIDTVYLSGYLRHAIGAWSHTLALSVGMADVKLDRTVNYGVGSYHTNGDTDGLAFGLLYEVGYTKFVNKNNTFALQPIANVELRHAMIDGYTETGSDAGLRVDDIKQTILTFGAGVRVQGLVGGRAFNDSAMLEARALVKADVGDRSGTSKHAIIHDTTQAEVESAEVGAVGVEAGVGLSVPLGRNLGSIIVDGSVEFRSGWTSANASAGYRISF